MAVELSKQMTPNDFADYFRFQIGVNVIPANSQLKIPLVEWKLNICGNWQEVPIPEEIHEQWKRENKFKDGLAVICGQVFHNEEHFGKWFNGIDCDNKLGLDEMCPDGIDKIAQITVVEQHANKEKCHMYFYTEEPIQSQAPLEGDNIPKIEIKSGGKFLLYCAGGIHKDGSRIEILNNKQVKTLDKESLEIRINDIFTKYGLTYLNEKATTKPLYQRDSTTKLHEGDNRGQYILSYLDSKKIKNPELDEDDLFYLARKYEKENCADAYPDEKIKNLVRQAMGYGEEHIVVNKKEKNIMSEIETKALELLYVNDKKDVLQKLKEHCIAIGEKTGDTILNEVIKKARKKIKNGYSIDEIPATMQSYNIGKGLINRTVRSLNDTEQIVVQVVIKGKPHWIDILSPTFNQMVRLGVQKEYGEIYADSKYETAIKNLHADALFNGTESKSIFNRCALVDGVLYYDLQDSDGTIYKISKDEIREAQHDENIPLFLKSPSAKTEASIQPKPLFDNDEALNELVKICRIREEDKIIFKSHLICYFLTGFPIPIAILHGEQGSAKTSTSSGMKSLHDPEGECALSLPEKVDDLAVNLSRHGTSNFDNIDNLSKELSQFLCKAVTGTQYVKRQLYSSGEEFSLTLKSKIILNGISPNIDQPDLLERSIFYELPTINKKERMTDKKFFEKLNELKPHVLGFVFKNIQKAMMIYDQVDKELDGTLPRMATFAVWGEAISRSLGYEPNAFIKRYEEKVDSSNLELRDEYPIIESLMKFVKDNVDKEITMSDLFSKVVDSNNERLPKDSKRLGKQLKQLSPIIRALGYEVITKINSVRPKTDNDLPRGVTLVKFSKIAEVSVDSFAN